MRKLRSLRWLCSLSLVASLLCGVAFGAEIPNLDDLGIDPWGEYEQLPSVLPTVQPTPSQVPGAGEGEDVYFLGEDVGVISSEHAIMPMSLEDDWLYTIKSGKIQVWGQQTAHTFPSSGSLSDGFTTLKTINDSGSYRSLPDVHISAGTQLYIYKNVDFPANKFSKIYYNGGFQVGPAGAFKSSTETYVSTLHGYGQGQLSVNGVPFGATYFGTVYNLDNVEYEITENVTTVGFLITFPNVVSQNGGSWVPSASFTNLSPKYIGFNVTDTLNITAEEINQGDVTNGLLGSIIDFLNLMLQGITNIFTTLAELPGQIVSALIDGLKSLFIPSSDDIENIKAQYMTLLEERLGFLWQAMTFITDTAQKFLTALEGSSDYVFNLPALTITLPSGEFTLVQAQTIDFDNGLMTVVRTAAGTMFSFVVVLGFLNVSEKMVIAIVSGKSYFDYLKGGGEE